MNTSGPCTTTWFQDADGDGYGNPAVSQVSCTQPLGYVANSDDCDDTSAITYPGAPEVNDDRDNQCAGSPGYGVIDEISGDVGFSDPTDSTQFCWTSQPSATSYQVARSDRPDFSGTCTFFNTVGRCLNDPAFPLTGTGHFYLVRALGPYVGSWGQDSSGRERTGIGGTESVCNDKVDNDGDGLIDCDDPDCGTSQGCTPVSCAPLVCPGGPGCDEQLGPAAFHGSDALLGYDINVGTGNLHIAATDAVVQPALGPILEFRRHYNSQGVANNVGLGNGWTHTYSWRASMPDATTIKVLTDAGRAIYFTSPTGGPSWTAPAGEFGTLTGMAATGFIYRTKFGTAFALDSIANAGRLLSITPADNMSITVSYLSGTTISSVNSGDRSLIFSYAGNNIGAVRDQDHDNSWHYQVSTNLDAVYLRDDISETLEGFVTYTYATIMVNGVPFSVGTNSSQLTRIQQAQSGLGSNMVMVDRGIFSYSRTNVVRAASSAVNGTLQDDVSLRYGLCADSQSSTIASLSGGTKTITSERVSGHQRISRIVSTAGAGYEGVEWTNAQLAWNPDLTLASVTDGNNVVTAFTNYDSKGNPGTMIEGSGGALARTTSFTYHPITSAPLTVSRLSVDGDSQHTVTYDYDSDYDANYNASPTNYIHQVVQTGKTDTSLSGTAGSSVTYTSRAYYDASNRVTRLEGANGNSEWLEYYPSVADYLLRDRLKSMRMNTSGAASLVSFVNSYDVYGRPTQLRSANGVQTDLIYNSRGQVLYRTVSAGLSSQVDIFTYNLAGNPVSFTTPEGTRVIQDFDAASRMWRRHAETAGASPTMPWSEVFAFDDQGRPTALRRFAGLGTTVTSVCSPTGTEEFCEERSYDNFRRLASVRTLSSTDTVCTGMDCEITFTYDNDGNLERETKVGLNTTSYIRDALNRVTRITLPTGNYSTLTYDINDRVITRKDPRDVDNGGGGGHRVSRYVYDDFGRLISLQTPDTGLLISNFNASSQRIRSRDAAGNTMTYVYDMADRLIGMVAPNPDQSISYVYDETGSVGGITYANTAGRLTSIQAYGSLGNRIFSHFSYDMLGRIVDDIEEGGPALLATTTTNVHYAWGANSELLSLTYPDGKVVSYNQSLQYAPRTKPGAITTVFKGTPAILASNVMYFADGETSAFTFGNGGIWSLTRNHRGEWTRLVSGPSVSPVLDQRYEYDSTGLGLMTAVHLFQGMSNAYDWTYGYDKLNRLTSYTANVRPVFDAYRWRYDEVGNRTAQNYNGALTAYTYADPTKSQLTSLSGAETDSWTYDANGMWATHTSPDGTIRYDYDTRNLLSQLYDVPTGQPLVRYEYDGSLRHWQRTDTRNGTWTQYYYDLRDRVLQEYEFIGVYRNGDKEYSVTDHVYLEDREVARVVLKYFRPCDGCAYVYEDDDIHLVHEDFRKGPFVLEKNWLAGIPGLLGWAGEVDAFGKWQNLGSLPGPDGKVGTADDVPVDFSNLKGFYNTFRDPVDALSTSLGRGSIFSRPSIGARLGGPWESQKAANDLWSARNSAYVPNGSDDLLGALGGKSVGPAPGSPQLPVSVPGRSLSYAEDSNNERAKAGTRAIDKAAEALDKAGDAAKAAKEGHPGSALKDAGLAAVDAGEAIDAAYLYLTGKEIYESVYDWLHDDRQYDDDPEGNYSGASVKYCTEDSSACDSGGGGVWVFGDFHGNHKDYWTHPTNPLGPGVDEGFVPSLDDPMTQKTMKSLMSRRVSWGKDPGPYIDPLQDDYFVTAPGPLQGVALYGGGNRDPLRPEPP